MKRALILGIGGQDGSYLAEYLLSMEYAVYGLYRRSSVDNLWRIAGIRDKVKLIQGDVTDFSSLQRAFDLAVPHEVYNLADQDDANWSRNIPLVSMHVTLGGVQNVLEIVKSTNKCHLFQPVSALMFAPSKDRLDENSILQPDSPFACMKAASYHLCQHYRRKYDLPVSCGIMFNHDSPKRSEDYLVHKVCRAAVRIAAGRQSKVGLGNLNERLDVGFAGDYVKAMHAMLQTEPNDFVVATEEATSIGQICNYASLPYICIYKHPQYFKDEPPLPRIGNCTKLRQATGWKPGMFLHQLVQEIKVAEQEKLECE